MIFQFHTPGLDLQTTVAGKCPSSPEDEQEKQGESRDRSRDFVTRTIVRAGRCLSHCSCKEIFEALSASPPTNKSILTDDEGNSVVIPLAERSKRYNPPAIYVMAFTGHSRIKGLTCIAIFDVLMTFQGLASADLKTRKAVRKHVKKNAMVFYTCQKQNKRFLQ
ncbi:uncharacterized protein TNCV_1996831 [Trichonephila clavipes]|uniref:Uncharacterized protein n=1 Tax=Trichonephila clavipes TaxID=2585209 RepID=A0A8X6RSZ5_TRICX|nr:uncharacterized protein TNCV_1996831 [Trichonephila clavipes]